MVSCIRYICSIIVNYNTSIGTEKLQNNFILQERGRTVWFDNCYTIISSSPGHIHYKNFSSINKS